MDARAITEEKKSSSELQRISTDAFDKRISAIEDQINEVDENVGKLVEIQIESIEKAMKIRANTLKETLLPNVEDEYKEQFFRLSQLTELQLGNSLPLKLAKEKEALDKIIEDAMEIYLEKDAIYSNLKEELENLSSGKLDLCGGGLSELPSELENLRKELDELTRDREKAFAVRCNILDEIKRAGFTLDFPETLAERVQEKFSREGHPTACHLIVEKNAAGECHMNADKLKEGLDVIRDCIRFYNQLENRMSTIEAEQIRPSSRAFFNKKSESSKKDVEHKECEELLDTVAKVVVRVIAGVEHDELFHLIYNSVAREKQNKSNDRCMIL